MSLTLEFLLPLAGILLGAKLAASLSQRLGFPAVFGELVLGLLVGPSVLGWIAPSETLHLLADLGVILLMFLAGLETDLSEMRRTGRASFLTATGGVALPLLGGLAFGLSTGMAFNQALFLGAVLTATSVSISAQTLREFGMLRSSVGITMMGAAIMDDIMGVIVFAVVMSLAGAGSLLLTLAKMALFFPLAWFVGDRLLPAVIRWTDRFNHRESGLAVMTGLLLVYAYSAEVFGSVASITGAYLLGVLVSRHVEKHHIVHSGMSAVGYGLLIPVFFVNIGLQATTAGLFASPLTTAVLVVIAVLTKVIGGGAGALLGGLSQRSAMQVGVSMISRGEVALVMAGAGLSAGLLDAASFSILIFVTLVSTLITPPLLRLSFTAPSISIPTGGIRQIFSIPQWQDFALDVVEIEE